jgi:hypothetical protein
VQKQIVRMQSVLSFGGNEIFVSQQRHCEAYCSFKHKA